MRHWSWSSTSTTSNPSLPPSMRERSNYNQVKDTLDLIASQSSHLARLNTRVSSSLGTETASAVARAKAAEALSNLERKKVLVSSTLRQAACVSPGQMES